MKGPESSSRRTVIQSVIFLKAFVFSPFSRVLRVILRFYLILRVKVLTHLLRSFLEDELRWRQADDGGLHERARRHVRESHRLDVSCSGARVPHAQVDFADVSHGDVAHGRYVAVTAFPLVLQDDVAGAAVT